jgi:hypothetical protein
MLDLGSLALVPLVFGLSAFGPGYWLIRRAGWRPVETATAALAFSVLLVGLASFAIGVLRLHPDIRVLLLAACVIATIAALPAVVRLARQDEGVRRGLVWFAILAVWAVALQALVKNYSGGNLVYDWLDHYERSRFFLGWLRTDTLFSGALLPSRPPLMNAFAAQVLALTRPRFPCYQMTAALLGVLAYFPMLLVARLFSPARCVSRILAIMLMFQPMFIQNVSYSWTRMTAVFFVLSAVGFYVAGWRAGDPGRTLFGFVCGAAAILTHYSSAPYVLFLALHFLFFVLPRRARPIREAAAVGLAAGAVLAPWLVWAGAVYGGGTVIRAGLASSGRPLPTASENLVKAALNLRDTLVPHLLRDEGRRDPDPAGPTWGRIHDDAFILYQGNLPLSLGSLGAVLLAIEAVRSRRQAREARADSVRFWAALAACAILGGIGVQGGRETLGLAHTALQPLVMIGVAFLASRFEDWPRWLRWLFACGLLVDAGLGVILHFWIQSYPLDLPGTWRGPWGLTFDDLAIMPANLRIIPADWNWGVKVGGRHLFVADLLGSLVRIPLALVASLFAIGTATLLRLAARRDRPA